MEFDTIRQMTMEIRDTRSIEMAKATAAKLRADPSLFERIAFAHLRAWRARVENGAYSERQYLERWEALAAQGMEACIAAILDLSHDWGSTMRSTAPFAGVLTQQEVVDIIERTPVKYEKIGV